MRRARFGAALCAPVLLLSCAQGGDSTRSTSDSEACADVWVAGAELPEDYSGCQEGGQTVVPELIPCAEHDGRWTAHDGRFIAVLGEEISAVPSGEDVLMLAC